ncbi:MAG: hypothetical protein J2P15_16590 [Micromonosporaceae bacterium]|nr:hypothetical protein [Micromonosporaceae bacterium]
MDPWSDDDEARRRPRTLSVGCLVALILSAVLAVGLIVVAASTLGGAFSNVQIR